MIIASKVSRRGMAAVLHKHFKTADIIVESAVFSWMRVLSPDYSGGGWNFYTLSNGGFFMSPDDDDKLFEMRSPNGFSAEVSAQDAGITAMLFAFRLSLKSWASPTFFFYGKEDGAAFFILKFSIIY